VLDSRPARGGRAIRRRRECVACGRRFTTFEAPEQPRLFVIKRGGGREEFSREKVLAGMMLACRKRPVSQEALVSAAEEIERRLMDSGSLEVSSEEIGELVMQRLQRLDPVAHVRFASVYREFQGLEEFLHFVGDSSERPDRTALMVD